MSSLQQRITALRVSGVQGDFIPQKLLFDIVSRSEILQELQRVNYPLEDVSESSDILFEAGRRIFAILVEVGGLEHAADFISRGLLDGKLPFQKEDLDNLEDSSLAIRVLKFQWDYLAPIWGDGSSSHKVLSASAKLPFTEEKFLSEGSSGKVFLVTLKATHQGFVQCADSDDVRVVRKELINCWSDSSGASQPDSVSRNRTLQDFTKEARVLKLLRHTTNPRIVKILGSFVYKGTYSLLFPPADMDLDGLLQGSPRAWVFKNNDEIVEELRGLANALNDVHSYRCQQTELELIGCHHDLKPNNILMFGGTLTLADFGLSRLIPAEHGSATDFKDCLGDYFSPESLDVNFSPQKIGRPSDIWSLGCVIIEIITFCEHGVNGVSQLRSLRRTESRPRYINSWFHSGKEMKVEVAAWLSKLREHSKDDIVKTLAVLASKMLDKTPENRPNADSVHSELTSICLASLATRIARQFEALLKEVGDFNLGIERKRFDEWCYGMGITPRNLMKNSVRTGIALQFYTDIRQRMLALLSLISPAPQKDENFSCQDGDIDLDDLYLSVRDQNDFLWKILPLETRKEIQVRWHRERLQTERLDELENIEHGADRKLANLAQRKRLVLLMEQNERSGGNRQLDLDDISDLEAFGDHSIGTYTCCSSDDDSEEIEAQQRVIVEWWQILDLDMPVMEELYVRMGMISSLPNVPDRPPELCVLTCKGYFYDKKDKARFGVVYAVPSSVAGFGAATPPPITLRDFIDKSQSVSQGCRPALGDRFALARALCLCIAELHAVRWLHHDLCPENVVFLSTPAGAANAVSIRDPYVIGFNHSRPDEDGNYTIERSYVQSKLIYQHPDYRNPRGSRRFNKTFDYYSLGVVLLEIGLWYSVQHVGIDLSSLKLPQKRDKLIEYAQRLGAYMGEIYRDAVVSCLSVKLDEESAVEEKFHQEVLAPLAACVV